MQLIRHQPDERVVRSQQRPVDQRLAMPGDHLAAFVEGQDHQRFGFSPRRLELLPLPFLAFVSGGLVAASSQASAVDLHGDPQAGEFVSGRQAPVSKLGQFTTPEREDLFAELHRDAADGLLVEPNTLLSPVPAEPRQ